MFNRTCLSLFSTSGFILSHFLFTDQKKWTARKSIFNSDLVFVRNEFDQAMSTVTKSSSCHRRGKRNQSDNNKSKAPKRFIFSLVWFEERLAAIASVILVIASIGRDRRSCFFQRCKSMKLISLLVYVFVRISYKWTCDCLTRKKVVWSKIQYRLCLVADRARTRRMNSLTWLIDDRSNLARGPRWSLQLIVESQWESRVSCRENSEKEVPKCPILDSSFELVYQKTATTYWSVRSRLVSFLKKNRTTCLPSLVWNCWGNVRIWP